MDELATLLRDARHILRNAERNLRSAEAGLLENETNLAEARTAVSLANHELNAAVTSADHSHRVVALEELAIATDYLRECEQRAASFTRLRVSAQNAATRALDVIRQVTAFAALPPQTPAPAQPQQNSTPSS